MWYLYLDESGDLGFDFVNKKPSKFFTITILVLEGEDANRKLLKGTKITSRRKFQAKPEPAELKGSKCPLPIKKYFFKQVSNVDFGIYALTLNKRCLFERLTKDKERVYNYIARLVLDKIPFNHANIGVKLVVDKSKTKKNIFEFNQYILNQIKSKFDPKIPLDIYHYESSTNYGLQAVDMFCWGIFQKYERENSEWRDVFADKIQFDEQYL